MSYDYERPSDETPSESAYNAVSEAKDCEPLELPPIVRAVEPEAMDAFIEESRKLTEVSIKFEYAGCEVKLTDDRVSVELPGSDS